MFKTWNLIPFILCISQISAPALAADLDGTLKKIKDSGTITIGYRDSSLPFSYIDDQQQPIGYAIDICRDVVDALAKDLSLAKINIAFNPVTGATRIPLIANGTVDLECGGTTNNVEREKQVAFGDTYFLTANRFMAKKADNITKIDDLKDKAVVSVSGTSNLKELTEVSNQRGLNLNILAAKDPAGALLLLDTGRAVALVEDDIILASLAAGSKTPDAYAISAGGFSPALPYSFMLRKDDPAFKAAVDAAMADLFKTGVITKLYAKWFQAPIPPKGLTLNVPMSAGLQKAVQNPTSSPDPSAY